MLAGVGTMRRGRSSRSPASYDDATSSTTREDRIRIREDLKRSIKAGVPAAVNIAATPDEQPPLQLQKTGGKFTLRHHMPVVGYNENNDTVLVQDPWTKPFWISVYRLADMAGTRGYVSLK